MAITASEMGVRSWEKRKRNKKSLAHMKRISKLGVEARRKKRRLTK